MKTIVPATAAAMFSMRLAPGQSLEQVVPELERIVRAAVPANADVESSCSRAATRASFDPREPAIGSRRTHSSARSASGPPSSAPGGSLPIVPALAGRGVPTVVTGFDLPDGNIHAPNERLLVAHIEAGVAAARELFVAWGQLPRD